MKSKHYSPLRYPGGKGKLLGFVKDLILHNGLDGGSYIEPYAGGASVALGLLIEDYVSEVHINDFDVSIYSFWQAILSHPDEFIKRVWDTPVTIEEWKKQKLVQKNIGDFNFLDIGFSTFFLNRTNRSGVLNAGVIGGNDQSGNYKLDARYNKEDLVKRLNVIANLESSIKLYNQDALDFIVKRLPDIYREGLIFLDPPYYVKGKRLYTSFYGHEDHKKIAHAIKNSKLKHWIVTYDNADEINEIYDLKNKIVYNLRYSVSHSSPKGAEVLFYSNDLKLPHKRVA